MTMTVLHSVSYALAVRGCAWARCCNEEYPPNCPKQSSFPRIASSGRSGGCESSELPPKQPSFSRDRFQGHHGEPKISWTFYGLPRALRSASVPGGDRTSLNRERKRSIWHLISICRGSCDRCAVLFPLPRCSPNLPSIGSTRPPIPPWGWRSSPRCEHVANGTDLFRAICERDIEGVVAK
jgi:hypothetical protein